MKYTVKQFYNVNLQVHYLDDRCEVVLLINGKPLGPSGMWSRGLMKSIFSMRAPGTLVQEFIKDCANARIDYWQRGFTEFRQLSASTVEIIRNELREALAKLMGK